MNKIIECVPNISEGRDLALVEDIVSAVKTAEVKNVHSDPDHNRSVVTMVGEPLPVMQAAFALTERAMQLLDIIDHAGVHPFIGVMDVIPFVPLKGITAEELVPLARGFGEKLWEELRLPIFFYGEAAKVAKRSDLPNVRRGGYWSLKEHVYDDKERKPDVGHGLHVTAGAAAVGVRDFLIAFNVNLKTTDVDIAKSIAKNIREKSGGLPGIRALGLYLESRKITQVSVNVTNHKMLSLSRVFTEVQKWAHEYQTGILSSELVGMIPEEAVFPEIKEALQMHNFSPNLVLRI